MFRRSSNNPWLPPGGLNAQAFPQIGGEDPSPGAGARFPGLLGATVVHDNASALKDSKLSVGTLYMGIYQIVKFTSAISRGQILVWDTLANNGLNDYEVTATVAATSAFKAGVALFTDAAATGKFGYIQVAGLATCLFDDNTDTTIGDLVFTGTAANTPAAAATVVAIDDADVTTLAGAVGVFKYMVGIAYETPVASGLTRVLLNPAGFVANIGRG